MRSRVITILATVALSAAGMVVSAGPAAADPARCGGWGTPADIFSSGGFSFKSGGTALYRGPYDDCQILWYGQPGHGIDVHCYLQNSFGSLFFYVRDTSTGGAGWAKNGQINWDGTPIAPCYS